MGCLYKISRYVDSERFTKANTLIRRSGALYDELLPSRPITRAKSSALRYASPRAFQGAFKRGGCRVGEKPVHSPSLDGHPAASAPTREERCDIRLLCPSVDRSSNTKAAPAWAAFLLPTGSTRGLHHRGGCRSGEWPVHCAPLMRFTLLYPNLLA